MANTRIPLQETTFISRSEYSLGGYSEFSIQSTDSEKKGNLLAG